MQKTNIGWATHVSNPIIARRKDNGTRGWVCTRISAGCGDGTGGRCYAEELNERLGTGLPYNRASEDLVTWELHEPELVKLRRHKGPATIFLGSMTDVFHHRIPDDYRDAIFTAGTENRQHLLMTLTKRANRMFMYCNSRAWDIHALNLMVGVTVENRASLFRIGILQHAKVARRFLSCEPLLEDLGPLDLRGIDLVIVGGETGRSSRPMQVAWVQSIVDQALAAGCVPFVKQDHGLYPGHQGRLPDALWAHQKVLTV